MSEILEPDEEIRVLMVEELSNVVFSPMRFVTGGEVRPQILCEEDRGRQVEVTTLFGMWLHLYT